MYPARRRKYYSKKYYKNRLFAPSMKKANMPNYYQMKGRIIQQTPALIKEPPTKLITRKDLDEYYQTLIKFKYPVGPPFDPTLYTFYGVTDLLRLDQLLNSEDFNEEYFQRFVDTLAKPDAPRGYKYVFDVIGMLFTVEPNDDGVGRFDFVWQSNLLTSGLVNIIDKQVGSTIEDTVYANIQCIPYTATKCMINRVAFTSSNVNITSSRQNTNDSSIRDDGYYPLVTSNVTQETYGSHITFEKTQLSSYEHYYCLNFKVLVYLVAD